MRILLPLLLVLPLACSSDQQPSVDGGDLRGPERAGDLGPGDQGAAPAPSLYVSGTRLRARYAVSPDRIRHFLGWHDTKLGLECTIGRAPDDQLRCVPPLAATHVFSDSLCRQPLYQATCEVPSHILLGGTVRKIGALYTGKVFIGQIEGRCRPFVGTPTDVYALEAGPGLNALAGAVLRIDHGKRLSPEYYSTSDGARQFVSWYDELRKEDCHFGTASDGSLYCLPEALTSTYYSDAGCSRRVVPSPGTDTPTLGAFRDPTRCPARDRFFTLGPLMKAAAVFVPTAQGCQSAGTLDTYALQAEVAPSAFFGPVSVLEEGGRIRASFALAEGGYRQLLGFKDTQLGGECDFGRLAADAAPRCLPTRQPASGVGSFYSDAMCSKMVDGAEFSVSACPAAQALLPVNSCTLGAKLRALGGTATFYAKGASCTAIAADPGTSYQPLGTEQAPDSLAAGSFVTE